MEDFSKKSNEPPWLLAEVVPHAGIDLCLTYPLSTIYDLKSYFASVCFCSMYVTATFSQFRTCQFHLKDHEMARTEKHFNFLQKAIGLLQYMHREMRTCSVGQ